MIEKNLLFNLADRIAKKVYKATFEFPQKFQFSIGEQLRRACLSIVLNIVEGGARIFLKEKRQFLNIAYGSLKETKYLINFCNELNLINNNFYEDIMDDINGLAKLLYGLLYKK